MVERVEVDVVVIGAGLSGLTATALLSEAGRRVLCLEARDHVGGRALTVRTPQGPVDLGATWFWPGEDQVAGLVRRLGVPTFPQHRAGDALLEQPVPATGSPGAQRVRGNPIDVPSHRFGAGAQDLAERLGATLPAGTVRCGSPVAGLTVYDDRVVVTTGGAHAAEPATYVEVTARAAVVALPPALAVDSIDFADGLHPAVADVAARTPVWMGDITKAVAVYDAPFWRESGLAGAAISYRGPFRELHDMSRADGVTAALFGFAPAAAFLDPGDEQARSAFVDQLVRLFGPRAGRPAAVHVRNWARERWTTSATPSSLARTAAFGHPALGADNPSTRVLWCSTETAEVGAGHLEGAIHAGARAARAILAPQ